VLTGGMGAALDLSTCRTDGLFLQC